MLKKHFKKIIAGTIIAISLIASSSTSAFIPLSVNQGGTGIGTLTGIPYGTGLAPFSTVNIGTGLSFTGGTLSATGGGTVTSVSGTNNRITSSGGATPVIDISAAYVGQSSITTVGTISSGAVPASLVTAGTFGSGAFTFPSTLTITTSETVPLVIGGTAVGSGLTIQSTSATGTTDFIKFLTGNNGATEAMRIIHNGSVGIGTTSPTASLSVIGTNSSTNNRVLNIVGGTGIAGTTTGQDISIFSGAGKEYDTGSATVGAAGSILIKGSPGGGLNDPTVTAGTYTAGLGASITSQGGSGGGVLDDPFDATVTLKGAAGGGLLYVGGDGGDASLGNSPSHSVGGKGGSMQFTTGFGASSQSKTTTIGGDSGSMIFSSNPAGNSGGRAGFTSSLAGSSGSYTISIGPGGTSTHSGSPNAAATMTGGNSGAFVLTQSNAGNATTTAVFGNAAATILGGTANNATIKLGDGGNATGGTVSNIGGNGSGLVVTFGKGGTGATANGTDGDGVFKDGYGNTIMTLKGNNTGFVNIPSLTASSAVGTDASKNLVSISVPTIVGNARQTGLTAAQALTTYTVGASDSTFQISANVLITSSTLHSFSVTCSYTDESNTARVLTLNFSQLTGAFVTTLTNALGASAYEGVPVHIRAKAGTTIIIASTGTFTTVTYNLEERILQE